MLKVLCTHTHTLTTSCYHVSYINLPVDRMTHEIKQFSRLPRLHQFTSITVVTMHDAFRVNTVDSTAALVSINSYIDGESKWPTKAKCTDVQPP